MLISLCCSTSFVSLPTLTTWLRSLLVLVYCVAANHFWQVLRCDHRPTGWATSAAWFLCASSLACSCASRSLASRSPSLVVSVDRLNESGKANSCWGMGRFIRSVILVIFLTVFTPQPARCTPLPTLNAGVVRERRGRLRQQNDFFRFGLHGNLMRNWATSFCCNLSGRQT